MKKSLLKFVALAVALALPTGVFAQTTETKPAAAQTTSTATKSTTTTTTSTTKKKSSSKKKSSKKPTPKATTEAPKVEPTKAPAK